MQSVASTIISAGTVRCSRQLTRNGTVMVFPGQVTDPGMQIAWRKIWTKHFTVNLREALELPADFDPKDYLLINEGDFVSVNETIAQRNDRKKRILNARNSGRFLGFSSGNLIFETNCENIESVLAGFPGMVTEIVPNRGAYLETNGAFLQGVWGNGKIGQGILLTLDDIEKDGIFDARNLSSAMSGSIIFANTCLDADVLQATARLSPGGLIFGSLPSALLPVAMKLPFPVIITDQLGPGRLSPPVNDVLGNNIIKCAYLYAVMSQGCQPGRPEIIIPQDEYIAEKPGILNELNVGSQVRILEGFYSGEIGFVTELLPLPSIEGQPENLDNFTDQVRICIDSETEIVIPVTNVEIIKVEGEAKG